MKLVILITVKGIVKSLAPIIFTLPIQNQFQNAVRTWVLGIVKVNANMSLWLAKNEAMRTREGSAGVPPHILNLLH